MIPERGLCEIAPVRQPRPVCEELQVVLDSWELGSRLTGLSLCLAAAGTGLADPSRRYANL
jgi:hypothetical protein